MSKVKLNSKEELDWLNKKQAYISVAFNTKNRKTKVVEPPVLTDNDEQILDKVWSETAKSKKEDQIIELKAA